MICPCCKRQMGDMNYELRFCPHCYAILEEYNLEKQDDKKIIKQEIKNIKKSLKVISKILNK